MYNHGFPITIVDNFLDDPYETVELANSVNYEIDTEGRWPGKRSVHVGEFAPVFFNRVIKKFISLYYGSENKYSFYASMYFQKIPSNLNEGWVHADVQSYVNGIIYLNPKPSINAGTSIIMPNTVNWDNAINIDVKKECYKNSKDDEIAREENNCQFHESIIIKNRFNRLLAFDGHINHKANFEKDTKNKERLTLVFFITQFVSENPLPLHRSRISS